MIQQIFSVYDNKAKAFCFPFFAANKELALRYFANGANDATLQLCLHPEDFSLFHLGSWDDETSKFSPFDAPQPLGIAASFKTTKE